ncbi:MAG: type 1 glutamine amidotransferase [Traorella sp.]
MKLKICWMYHDLMDLYGDKGNIQVLKRRCLKRNIDCIVDTCSLNEEKDLSEYDLLFIGGGADKEQSLLVLDLLKRKENLQKALDSKTFVLLICGGYQLFGQYYLDGDGNKIEGLGFFDYYTESASRDIRCIGNIAIEVNIDGESFKAVGFENHGGQTKNVKTPLGKVLAGQGNSFGCGYEGFYNGQVLGTYMHGPLLPKNPKIADIVIQKALSKRYQDVKLIALDDTLEMKAQEVMLGRILK